MSALLQERIGSYSRAATAGNEDVADDCTHLNDTSQNRFVVLPSEFGEAIHPGLHQIYAMAQRGFLCTHAAGLSPWAIERNPLANLTFTPLHVCTNAYMQGVEAIKLALRRHVNTEIDRTKARLRMLRRLPVNHDGEGAAAANERSVDAAIFFLDGFAFALHPSTTIDDDGNAVLEFRDRDKGFFGDITFKDSGQVEIYFRPQKAPSEMLSGRVHEAEILDFLATKLGCASRGS